MERKRGKGERDGTGERGIHGKEERGTGKWDKGKEAGKEGRANSFFFM